MVGLQFRQYAKCIGPPPVPLTLRAQHRLASRLMFSSGELLLAGRIRLLISGGAALPEDLGYIYLGAGLPIVQGYGLTETSPVITAPT